MGHCATQQFMFPKVMLLPLSCFKVHVACVIFHPHSGAFTGSVIDGERERNRGTLKGGTEEGKEMRICNSTTILFNVVLPPPQKSCIKENLVQILVFP